MIAVAWETFREAIRKRVILIIAILTVVYIVLFSLMIRFTMEDMRKSFIDDAEIIKITTGIISILGFYFSSMITAFVTIMASVGTISNDIESGIIHSVISKPIRRMEYILGKYIGIAIMAIGYSSFLYVFLIVLQVFYNISPLNHIQPAVFLQGLALFCYEPLILLSFCLFGSVVLKTMSNGIVTIGIYILGIAGGMMEQIGSAVNLHGLEKWGIVLSLISPFDSVYRKMISVLYSSVDFVGSVIAGPFFMSTKVPSIWMMFYSAFFCLGFMLLAVKKFNRKDI